MVGMGRRWERGMERKRRVEGDRVEESRSRRGKEGKGGVLKGEGLWITTQRGEKRRGREKEWVRKGLGQGACLWRATQRGRGRGRGRGMKRGRQRGPASAALC